MKHAIVSLGQQNTATRNELLKILRRLDARITRLERAKPAAPRAKPAAKMIRGVPDWVPAAYRVSVRRWLRANPGFRVVTGGCRSRSGDRGWYLCERVKTPWIIRSAAYTAGPRGNPNPLLLLRSKSPK